MKHTILIVDDDAPVRAAMQATLKDLYAVLTASSGAEALAILADTVAHVVIADMMMPGMTGRELLKRMRATYNGGIVRILYTAGADHAEILDALQSGDAWRYIEKPFSVDVIRDLVASATRIWDERHLMGAVDEIRMSIRDHAASDVVSMQAVTGQLADIRAMLGETVSGGTLTDREQDRHIRILEAKIGIIEEHAAPLSSGAMPKAVSDHGSKLIEQAAINGTVMGAISSLTAKVDAMQGSTTDSKGRSVPPANMATVEGKASGARTAAIVGAISGAASPVLVELVKALLRVP